MHEHPSLLHSLPVVSEGYWSRRLRAEVAFAEQVATSAAPRPGTGAGDGPATQGVRSRLEGALSEVVAKTRASGAITKDIALAFEQANADLAVECKKLELVCAGHAHIDMNWMWGYQETVSITIDTMRTVLALLDRFPRMAFSQSQASVYQIIDRYAPQLVDEVRSRIAQGRWEVTATQWVESDMNLPSGESLARQMQYAREYLTERFNAPESAFELVFLPDTFGHNANTPEIFASAGVRYLYHCRGISAYHVSRWEAPSGRSIVAYREPRWYNTEIAPDIVEFLPRFHAETGLTAALCVYGVGDHGGGPTVRDLELLEDMSGWPLFPTISFGTIHGYFDRIAGSTGELPVTKEERNPLFTGCYSSQSRIKAANRRAERLLAEAEIATTLAELWAGPSAYASAIQANLDEGWRNTLFSHFHDILPGSGVQLTREYALGKFQETAAAALSAQSESMRRLSAWAGAGAASGKGTARAAGADARRESAPAAPATANEHVERGEAGNAFGAGVGFQSAGFSVTATERGTGTRRRYDLYNFLQWERSESAEVVVWDWPEAAETARCFDASGTALPTQLVEEGRDPYWGHRFLRLRVRVRVPGYSRTSVFVRSAPGPAHEKPFFPWGVDTWLIEHPHTIVLENERLRAELDPTTLQLVTLVDKTNGTAMGAKGDAAQRPVLGTFRLVHEEAERMTAWVVGRYQTVTPIATTTRITARHTDRDSLHQWIEYEAPLRSGGGDSRLTVRISLDRDAARLVYEVGCHWLETGFPNRSVPQLQFALHPGAEVERVRYDIPFGTIDREQSDIDLPSNGLAALVPRDANVPVIQLTAAAHQAYRAADGTLSLTLLRSSVDPDPYPELGFHQFSFAIGVLPPPARRDNVAALREAAEFAFPLRAYSTVSPATGDGAAAAGEAETTTGPGGARGNGTPGKTGRGAAAGTAPTPSFPLLGVETAGCVVTAVKSSRARVDAGGTVGKYRFVLRVAEVRGVKDQVRVQIPTAGGNDGPRVVEARVLDLHERPVQGGGAAVRGGTAELSVGPHQVVTVEIVTESPNSP